MTSVNEKGEERRDLKRTSGATRRIVVDDRLHEEAPRAQGRRLDSPVDIETPSKITGAGSETATAHERSAHRSRVASAPMKTNGDVTLRENVSRSGRGSTANKIAAKPNQSGQLNVKRMIFIIGGMVAFPFVVTAIILLLPSSGKQKIDKTSQPAVAAPSPTIESAASVGVPSQSSTPNVNIPPPQARVEPSPNADPSIPVDSAEIRSMSIQLAAQISQKSGYEFAPEFVEVIRALTREYSSQKALSGARQYRREINKAFRDEGLNPLVGYALAMSRSKFDSGANHKGIGIWQIPTAVARSQGYLGSTENSGKLKIPEESAQITASYTKQLLSTFDAEDFMYAIGCFGMSLQEAGRLQARLVNAAPDSRSRRDIMKMINARVLTADQVDNIARFFAAGIVGENPQKFGLDGSQTFSSLY